MTFLFPKNMCKACIVCKQFLYMYQTKLCKLVLVDATKRNVGQIKLISYIVSTDVFFHQQWSEKIVYFEHSLGSNLSSGTLQFTLLVKWHCQIWLKWMTTILIFPCDISFPEGALAGVHCTPVFWEGLNCTPEFGVNNRQCTQKLPGQPYI